MSFGLYVPSYKRAKTTTTYKLLQDYKYVVRASEEAEYRAAGIDSLWVVEDEKINSMIKVINYIHDNAPEDIICTIDDDIKYMIYRLDKNETVTDPEVITAEFERIGQLMLDLDIGYGCVDASRVPYGYTSEFAFSGPSGGLRWVNKKCFKSRFLDEIGYCCDVDVVLHELLVNRIILKPKYLCTCGGTDTNEGGNSAKTRADQLASVELMKQKWGKYYDFNEKNNTPYIRVKR